MKTNSLFDTARFSLVVASAALGATACSRDPGGETGRPQPAESTAAASTARTADTHVVDTARLGQGAGPAVSPKDPVATANPEMKKVLEQLGALGAKPLSTLSPEEARKQPTPADAVKAVLTKDGKSIAPLEMAKVEARKIPGGGGPVDARIYTPKTTDKKPLPVIVYFHGGGWVIADLDVYDATPRALAKGVNAIVVSADYRHAPENKFPAAHDDAYAAYEWVTKNAASFGGDPKRIAVAGESAGGNLAANVSIMARDNGAPMPVHQLLVYPIAQTTVDTPSYIEWAYGKPLDKAGMVWFFEKTLRTQGDKNDPRLDLVHANLRGLPKTTIVQAEIDPLKSDGDMLARSLEAAGVSVDKKLYEGVTHEFFGMAAAVTQAKDAETYAIDRLKDAFNASSGGPEMPRLRRGRVALQPSDVVEILETPCRAVVSEQRSATDHRHVAPVERNVRRPGEGVLKIDSADARQNLDTERLQSEPIPVPLVGKGHLVDGMLGDWRPE